MVTQQMYLTREGYKKLEQELHYLDTVRREQVAQALQDAAEEGDVLENGALEIARQDQAFLQGRILELKSILRNAVVIDETEIPEDRVGLGSYVTVVEVGSDDHPETYRIVGPVEADPLDGKVSNESPLGRALMDRRVGEEVIVSAPAGQEMFRIVEIH